MSLIELRDVTRSFPGVPEVQALKAVNLTVEAGDYVSIVGPSGSGKSTMLNLLGLLDRPTVGEYRIDGVVTGVLDDDQRARVRAQWIGFVFQAFHLMPRRTVLENVMMPMLYSGVPREEREGRARAVLDRVGLGHRMGFHPPTLSGGERQRVAVARAVVSTPRILLADEPTGNLDESMRDEILDVLETLNAEGLTLVVVTHDSAVARRARRRLRLAKGVVTDITNG